MMGSVVFCPKSRGELRLKDKGLWDLKIHKGMCLAKDSTPPIKSEHCSPWAEALLLEICVLDDRYLGSSNLFSESFLLFSFACRAIVGIVVMSPVGFRKGLGLGTEGCSCMHLV